MHSWWKFSSKDVNKKAKKTRKGTIIEALQRKLKIPSEDKSNNRSVASHRPNSETFSTKGSLSRVVSRSSSPSTQVSRCQSFAERTSVQPLPLPHNHHAGISRSSSGLNVSKPGLGRCGKPRLHIPLPKPDRVSPGAVTTDIDGDLPTASVSSDCSVDSDDPNDSRLPSPRGHDFENEIINVANSPLRGSDKSLPEIEIGPLTVTARSCYNLGRMHKDQSPVMSNSKETLRPAMMLVNSQSLSSSPKRGHLGAHLSPLQINHSALGIGSAPDSSMSSPSRSPMRIICPEHITSSAFFSSKAYLDPCFLGSCPSSSPGSGHNSGHNSMGRDLSAQLVWQQSSGGGPECSPIPSPRMTSPGPSSQIHSEAVTPLHPRAGGPSTEPPIGWSDDGKQQSHRLPLPPTSIGNSSPFNPANTTVTASVPKSPGRADTPIGIGSQWKKGKLIGRGTFGHVYVGFSSESGEMCAMKEVTLLSDEPKSKESARHLMQEIALLSMYRHPNIVQYYGSETIDDKLYVYLEYVSGGSIHKLLQEYGQLGELAIRSYTQQILSGLAYLHAKNTVHRDIKGANILVDPNGRVKLADFGMAKHITGQSSPLSFKGSPYWMAPEVIKNSNGCNLAVDVWSLGCTVLEMATTKPPWSQYEGVAAMFKIGNSKELPPIPDYLSDMCKDFVMQCLQRNPQHRPTATQLLEHPFVKNSLPLARHIPIHEPLELPSGMSNGIRLMGTNNARNLSSMEVEVAAVNQPRGGRICAPPTDIHIPRNITYSVSPSGSPLLNQRSPQHINGRMSPSPISSPRTTSGSSTPLSGGNGALPFSLVKQSLYLTEGSSNLPRSPNNFHVNSSSGYQDQSHNLFRPQSLVFHEIKPSDTVVQGEANDGQSVLIDRVSYQHLWGNAKLSPIDFGPGSSALGGLVGI